MADRRRYTDDVPAEYEARLREYCTALPEVREEHAWVGTRWKVRSYTFAHVLGVEDAGEPPRVVLSFRATGEELEVLRQAGPPFQFLGWGRDAMGLTLDAQTDWDDVRDLLIESYCAHAPKKLVAGVERPPAVEPD
jgi:hypothetical protein